MYHGNPKPSFLGCITHILGCKTFIFHGFGVQGYLVILRQRDIFWGMVNELSSRDPVCSKGDGLVTNSTIGDKRATN